MSIKEKKILVTGAAGFIGSNLTDSLLELGTEVIGIDNLFNGRLDNLEDARKNKDFKFFKTDIRDLSRIIDISKDIDIIIHEAAFTSVPQSLLMPESCNDVNINGVLNILNAARLNDIEKVIFATSSSVFGDLPGLPKKDDAKRKPISPYGVSKLAGESYMQAYHSVYGINTTCLRYFNVFGPRQRDSPYSGVIAIWLGKLLRDEELLIFGDGEQSRDFTYIKDVLQANLLAAEHNAPGEILNVGAGSPITLTDLAKLILKITNKANLKIKYTDPRAGDIKHSYADISKARELIKFEPKFNQKDGLINYFKWYRDKYNIDLEIIE